MKPALTLIEILLIITIISIVSIPSFLGVTSIRNKQALGLARENLTATFTRAHIFSREGKDDAEWGVFCKDIYTYQMLSRKLGTETVEAESSLGKGIFFDNCDWQRVWFLAQSGDVENGVIISIKNNSGVEQRIQILSSGSVVEL